MRRALLVAATLAIAFAAHAQQAPQGDPIADTVVRDVEFGVTARHFGLERQVEMLQWQAVREGYRQVWSDEVIGSGGYAPGHANPGGFPLRSQRWIASPITIDGKPLDPQVIDRLGDWRRFRPNFSALPGNLAATFQPEGDGLGSAENPLDPEIGDLRIQWRELTLPPLAGKVALRDGRWHLASATKPERPPPAESVSPRLAPWLLGAGALVVLLGLALSRRRRR